jgi:hypothetical protein
MSYFSNPTQTEGTKREVTVSDDNVQELLSEILKQLKIINFHLSLMTDNIITKQEIE